MSRPLPGPLEALALIVGLSPPLIRLLNGPHLSSLSLTLLPELGATSSCPLTLSGMLPSLQSPLILYSHGSQTVVRGAAC